MKTILSNQKYKHIAIALLIFLCFLISSCKSCHCPAYSINTVETENHHS